jgi:hypothetical protein
MVPTISETANPADEKKKESIVGFIGGASDA